MQSYNSKSMSTTDWCGRLDFIKFKARVATFHMALVLHYAVWVLSTEGHKLYATVLAASIHMGRWLAVGDFPGKSRLCFVLNP